MRELKARGCRFSLDDFGSGVSSFMYLKTLPVDFLKIDGQFASHIATDPVDRSMVEAITKIGRAMRVATIAEKVESAEVLEVLKQIGVDYIQGFICPSRCAIEDVFRLALDCRLRRTHEEHVSHRSRWVSKKSICWSTWPRATSSRSAGRSSCSAASPRPTGASAPSSCARSSR